MMMTSCCYGNKNDDDVMLVWYIYCVKFIVFSFTVVRFLCSISIRKTRAPAGFGGGEWPGACKDGGRCAREDCNDAGGSSWPSVLGPTRPALPKTIFFRIEIEHKNHTTVNEKSINFTQ